jgi:hypothetical protein
MVPLMASARLPYGLVDFDPDVVDLLYDRRSSAIDRTAAGGMLCPFQAHGDRIGWLDGDYRKGTVAHGEPSISFRVSPTYIYEDCLNNFICGRDLVAQAGN